MHWAWNRADSELVWLREFTMFVPEMRCVWSKRLPGFLLALSRLRQKQKEKLTTLQEFEQTSPSSCCSDVFAAFRFGHVNLHSNDKYLGQTSLRSVWGSQIVTKLILSNMSEAKPNPFTVSHFKQTGKSPHSVMYWVSTITHQKISCCSCNQCNAHRQI